MDNPILTPAVDRAKLAGRIAVLRTAASTGSDGALEEFGRVEAEFQSLSDESRSNLLGTSLTWSPDDLREAAWLRGTSDGLATLGYALCEALAERHGWNDARTRQVMARTLCHMGDVVKWEVAVTRGPQHDFAKPHALMRAAMACGHHREPLRMRFDGRSLTCTLESLYFRVLLLARFSSGALNSKQIEILDAWMWLWMPALQGVDASPAAGALRADLDSREGLRLGPRGDEGPSLYLPPEPIEAAYRSIVAELQAGRMVPATGIASGFRLEEHVAVLDLIRQGLREATRGRVARAERRETNLRVELYLGLVEILSRGFGPAPPSVPTLTLATRDGERLSDLRLERDRDISADAVYERRRRMVRVMNLSDSGFGIESEAIDGDAVAVGDLVGLRLEANGVLEICKVVRVAPSGSAGRTWIGVRRLSRHARPVEVSGAGGRASSFTLLFVPGEDQSGRHDAWLVTERSYRTDPGPMQATVGDDVYTLRLNRPRDRGRGWVLAGFEVLAVDPASGIRSA